MRSGNLRNKVTIQQIGNAVNEFGEIENGNFQNFKITWASITPISGKESFLSNTDFSKVTHKIKIRFFDGLDASMRLVWQDRIFNINSFRNISERDKEIEILATESINGN